MVTDTPQVPERIAPYLASARDFVRRALGVELDGTETSLAFVDHYLGEVVGRGEGGALRPEVLALTAAALGAYFGEVVLRRFGAGDRGAEGDTGLSGGRWLVEDDDPARWRIELQPLELRFSPMAMVAEAIAAGEVPGYDAQVTTRAAWMAPLADALAASAPVDEAYFYSLTGRFESIEQMVDILAELARRERERAP